MRRQACVHGRWCLLGEQRLGAVAGALPTGTQYAVAAANRHNNRAGVKAQRLELHDAAVSCTCTTTSFPRML